MPFLHLQMLVASVWCDMRTRICCAHVLILGCTLTALSPMCSLPLSAQELGETLRTIVGFEQSGASSAQSAQRFFGDLYVSLPFPFQAKERQHVGNSAPFSFGPKVRVFTDVRITTVPQQVRSTVGQFTGEFAQQVADLKVNEIAQATEFLAGVETRLLRLDRPMVSFDGKTFQRFTLNLVFAGGAVTPITPRQSIELFDIRPGTLRDQDRRRLLASFPDTDFTNADYVAFTTKDRNRFLRQYYGGFRFKTYYFGCAANDTVDCENKRLGRFPSTIDVLFGGNEAVTGGRFRGSILRIDFFQSIPVEGKFGSVFFFGSFLMKPVRTIIQDPLLLQSAIPCGGAATAACVSVPSASTAMVFTPQINRDYYRIGVGVELLSLFKEIANLHSTSTTRVN